MGAFGAMQKHSEHDSRFFLQFHEHLKIVQVPGVADKELRTPIECIRKFIREDFDDFETNQPVIGIKYLIRSFSTKAWKGKQFSGNKHTPCNRIVNHHHMNYHYKFWKDRDKTLHDEAVQRKRIVD